MAPFISVFDLVKSFIPKKLWIFIPFMMFFEFWYNSSYAFSNAIKVLKNGLFVGG